MAIYWVAVEEVPTKKDAEEGKVTKLILQPTAVSARNEQEAAIKVALDNETLKGIDRDRMQVSVRPF